MELKGIYGAIALSVDVKAGTCATVRALFGAEHSEAAAFAGPRELAVELDGQVHFSDEARAYDAERDAYLLREHSIRVLRYENRIVFDWPSLILDEIREAARDILSK